MTVGIRHAMLPDGSRKAFEATGRGYPTVCLEASRFSSFISNEHYLQWPAVWRRLRRGRQMISLDVVEDGSRAPEMRPAALSRLVAEVAAVVDAIDADRVALVAPLFAGPVGIAYAAAHPERVSHLALVFTFARGSDYLTHPRLRALHAIRSADPPLYFRTLASEMLGWGDSEQAAALAEFLRDRVGLEGLRLTGRAIGRLDASALQHQVRAKTLVLQRSGLALPTLEVARGMAEAIPGAELRLIEGTSALPLVGDLDALIDELNGFLPIGGEAASNGDARASGRGAQIRPTRRELQVLQLVAHGLSNSEIGQELDIAVPTVKRHLYKSYRKLGARNRTEAVAIARDLALLA